MEEITENINNLSIDNKKPLKPFLKWVGGKSQNIDEIEKHMPLEINNYREIFVGGGSVLIRFMEKIENKEIVVRNNIYAYDINEALINVYKNIQQNVDIFIQTIKKIIEEFKEIPLDADKLTLNRKPNDIQTAKLLRENYYYWIRNNYNKMSKEDKKSPDGSAMFVFLNKTCFRGLWRESKNGFNVPYGNYANPEIINESHIKKISDLIQNVRFEHMSFDQSIQTAESGDYLYMDPPYAPTTENSFVSYSVDGFDNKSHKALFGLIHELKNKDIKMTMSNSNADMVLDEFKKEQYKITHITAKRAINSKKPGKKAVELIINNF